MPRFDQVAIVGVGLLGGSIGRALCEKKLANKVVGIGRDQSKLARAQNAGILHEATTELADGVQAADLVVVCTPVETVAKTVAEVLHEAQESCLVTDVGSTKSIIVEAVAATVGESKAARFVGSHPLAGDHRTGAEHARGDLLAGRTVVVTPVGENPPQSIDRICEFWRSLEARTTLLSPAEHDSAIAITSHLPHAVATVLAAATPRERLSLAATGWADTTRVAAADPQLWRQIFLSNREQVLAAIAEFEQQLSKFRTALDSGNEDQLEQLLAEGKRTRDALGN